MIGRFNSDHPQNRHGIAIYQSRNKGTTDDSIAGSTSTPFDLNRNAGGSSGSSAAAVMFDVVSGPHSSDPFRLLEKNASYTFAVGRQVDNFFSLMSRYACFSSMNSVPFLWISVEAVMHLTISEMKQANRVRTSVMDTIQTVHDDNDLIVTSTQTRPAIKNAAETIGPEIINGQFVGSPIGWYLTYPFNLIPHPSPSVLAGVDSDGSPVGMQLVGRQFDDDTILAAIERERP